MEALSDSLAAGAGLGCGDGSEINFDGCLDSDESGLLTDDSVAHGLLEIASLESEVTSVGVSCLAGDLRRVVLSLGVLPMVGEGKSGG
jgi:hypothetical protein